MRRAFELDVLACPRCGGRMRLIATIEDPRLIRRILAHLELPPEGPTACPARPPPPGRSADLFSDMPASPVRIQRSAELCPRTPHPLAESSRRLGRTHPSQPNAPPRPQVFALTGSSSTL